MKIFNRSDQVQGDELVTKKGIGSVVKIAYLFGDILSAALRQGAHRTRNPQIKFLIVAHIGMFFLSTTHGQSHFIAQNGYMHFKSEAPLELIEATSKQLSGVFKPVESTFAFAVDIRSFQGFNSPLQREHFNENYLESKRFPKATFVGRIIEDIDFSVPGEYEVRAKGILEVHGIKQERIIKGKLYISNDGVRISANFTVMLEDHQISIPQIVHQKIAEEIFVDMGILLLPATAK